MENIEEI